jgi:hypothetical protein
MLYTQGPTNQKNTLLITTISIYAYSLCQLPHIAQCTMHNDVCKQRNQKSMHADQTLITKLRT